MDNVLVTLAFGVSALCAALMGFAIQRGATCTVAAVDELVIALGRAGIAVRHLQQRPRTLESTFLQLTGGATIPRGQAPAATPAIATGSRET